MSVDTRKKMAAMQAEALRMLLDDCVDEPTAVEFRDGTPTVFYRAPPEAEGEAGGPVGDIVDVVATITAVVADPDLELDALELIAVIADDEGIAATAWTLTDDVARGLAGGGLSPEAFTAALNETQREVELETSPV